MSQTFKLSNFPILKLFHVSELPLGTTQNVSNVFRSALATLGRSEVICDSSRDRGVLINTLFAEEQEKFEQGERPDPPTLQEIKLVVDDIVEQSDSFCKPERTETYAILTANNSPFASIIFYNLTYIGGTGDDLVNFVHPYIIPLTTNTAGEESWLDFVPKFLSYCLNNYIQVGTSAKLLYILDFTFPTDNPDHRWVLNTIPQFTLNLQEQDLQFETQFFGLDNVLTRVFL